MKKILSILWVIIIAGTIFISINFFKPDTRKEEIVDTEILTETEILPSDLNEEQSQTFGSYLTSGDSYFTQGNYTKAVQDYQKASALNPQSSQALLKLGTAQLKNNQPLDAKTTLTSANQINPDSTEIKLALAKADLNSRNVEEAKNIVWALDQNNLEIKYYKAIILVLYKQFDEAQNLFQEITNSESLVNTEFVEKSNKFLAAYANFSYFKEAEQIFLELSLAKTLTEVTEYEAAIPLLFEILNEKNNYRDAWIVLGFAYLNTGKISDAISALSKAKDLTPEKPETLFLLGLSHFANDEIDKAIYYIEAADKAGYEPKDQINLKLGDLYLIKENYNKAAVKYESVIAKNKQNIDVYVKAVWLNIDKLNKSQKALELALETLESHPENEMSLNLVGWAYTANGNYQKGEQYLSQVLKINPGFAAANLNFGWLKEKQGKVTLAKEYYKKAYVLGRGNAIGNLSAIRFNKLAEAEF